MTLKVILGLLIVISVMSGGFYLYYQNTQSRLAILQENQARLELSVKMQSYTIERQKEFLEMQQEYSRQLQRGLTEAESSRGKLEEIFRKHDLDALSRAKPEMIEKRVNDATRRVFKELETQTEMWYNENR
jgi:hypothetical protein